MNKFLKYAYANGIKNALLEELTKSAGVMSALGGIPRAFRGGLWGAGLGGAHGALSSGTEDDILRGALTGGLIGTGVGYGSRHLTKRLKDFSKQAPKDLWAGRGSPEARELASKTIGEGAERLWKDPAERKALGKALRSMGGLGLAGGVAATPLYNRAQRNQPPGYSDLYRYYMQTQMPQQAQMYRGM